MGNTILAKGVNHILAKRDNSAWPKGAKLSGFSTDNADYLERLMPVLERERIHPSGVVRLRDAAFCEEGASCNCHHRRNIRPYWKMMTTSGWGTVSEWTGM